MLSESNLTGCLILIAVDWVGWCCTVGVDVVVCVYVSLFYDYLILRASISYLVTLSWPYCAAPDSGGGFDAAFDLGGFNADSDSTGFIAA